MSDSRRSFGRNLKDSLGRLVRLILGLNLYDEDQGLSERQQILATRIYCCSLIGSLFLMTFFAALLPKTQTIIFGAPTAMNFERLTKYYGIVPTCNCLFGTMNFKEFVTFDVQYHQICSSEFIRQDWISSIFPSESSSLNVLDFRLSASSQFEILRFFCERSRQITEKGKVSFSHKVFTSLAAFSRSTLEEETNKAFEKYKSIYFYFSQVEDRFFEKIIDEYRFVSALRTNFHVRIVPGNDSYEIIPVSYPQMENEDCFCDEEPDCIFPARIYNYSSSINSSNAEIFSPVPGFFIGCTPEKSLRKSTFECLYNATCLTVAFPGRAAIPLNYIDRKTRFQLNTTVELLLQEAMLEHWRLSIDFDRYFARCAPRSCSLVLTRRFVITYIVSLLISIFSGLNIATRFISMIIVKFILVKCFRIFAIEQESQPTANIVVGRRARLKNICGLIWQKLKSLNMFETTMNNVQDGIYATRLYLLLMLVSVVILLVYDVSIKISEQVIVRNPTIEQVDSIREVHGTNASCPCQKQSIERTAFAKIEIRLDPFCSSSFVDENGWLRYWPMRFRNGTIDRSVRFHPSDFRRTGVHFLRYLKIFCDLANESWAGDKKLILDEPFITSEVMEKSFFAIITLRWKLYLQKSTFGMIVARSEILKQKIHESRLVSKSFNSVRPVSQFINNTWSVRFVSGTIEDMFGWSCSCVWNNQCQQPMGFVCSTLDCVANHHFYVQFIQGLYMGCDLFSFQSSSLSCFYDQTCVQLLKDLRLLEYDNIYLPVDLSGIDALNMTGYFDYLPSESVLQLFSVHFLAKSTVDANYTAYFQECQVKACTYSVTGRKSFILIVTVIIGILGGLNVTLRLSVPIIIVVIRKFVQTFRRPNIVVPWTPRFIDSIRENILKINVYERKPNILNQYIATRIYLLIVLIAFIVVSVFTLSQTNILTSNVKEPNVTDFEGLDSMGYDFLTCPCSNTLIQFSHFSQNVWEDDTFCNQISYNPTVNIDSMEAEKVWTDPDMIIVHGLMNTLVERCNSFWRFVFIVPDNIFVLSFITVELAPPRIFYSTISSMLLESWQHDTEYFESYYNSLTDFFKANKYLSAYESSWKVENFNFDDNYVLRFQPVSSADGMMGCATGMNNFTRSLVVYNADGKEIAVPGLVGSCSISEGLYESKLVCFFNETCQHMFDELLYLISPSLHINSTKYRPDISIGDNIRNSIRNMWNISVNYSEYFNLCKPAYCTYSYIERNDIVSVITTLLGLYGGLTTGLKIFVWQAGRLIRYIHVRCQNRH